MRLAEATSCPELTHHFPAQGPCPPLHPPGWASLLLHLHYRGVNQLLPWTSQVTNFQKVNPGRKQISPVRRLEAPQPRLCIWRQDLSSPRAASLTPAQPSHAASPSAAHCTLVASALGLMQPSSDTARGTRGRMLLVSRFGGCWERCAARDAGAPVRSRGSRW